MSEDNKTIKIGQILDRNVMPQIDNPDDFRGYLQNNKIKSKKRLVDGSDLRSSQLNFDNEKIEAMMMNPTNKMMVVSNDGHVLDGHHRWIANQKMGRKCLILQTELPILELIKTANDYNNQLNEETLDDIGDLNHEKFGPMLDIFVQFASKKLGIKSLPSMKLEKEPMETSFGGYNPSNKSIVVITKNRHPMDIYRTVAHELVHHKQNEDGRLGKDIAKEGSTGSPIENEANSEAGKIMRWFAKSNPEMFKSGYVTEETLTEKKRGSLSLKNWFDKSKSKDGKKGWVQVGGRYDGKPCARQPGQTSTPKCRSSAERASMSKKEREYAFKKKQREDPNQPEKSGAAKPTMVKTYKHQKESYHMDKKTLQEKKDACYHKVKSRYKVWPSAYASGALVKCRKVGADNWGNKSQVDENFEKFMSNPSNRLEGTNSIAEIYKKMTPGQKIVKKKLAQEDNTIPRVGLPDSESPGEMTTQYRPMMAGGYGGAGTIPMAESIIDWISNPVTQNRFIAKYGDRASVKLMEAAQRLSDIETGNRNPKFFTHIREAWSYGKDPNDRMGTLPNQGKEEMSEEDKVVDLGKKREDKKLSDFHKSFMSDVGEKAKEMSKLISSYREAGKLPFEVGTRFSTEHSRAKKLPPMKVTGYYVNPKNPDGDYGYHVERRLGSDEDDVEKTTVALRHPGLEKLHGAEKFASLVAGFQQIGKLKSIKESQEEQDALKKIQQIGSWIKSGAQVDKETGKEIIKLPHVNDLPDNLKQFKVDEESEDVIKPAKSLKGYKKHIHPQSTFEKKTLGESTPAWQRKEGKNPEGGLNQKGVESYRRENPGSKLQTAVTTEPSKLKKGSKSAKRRLSFCRRMKGMKKKLTSAKTARDPDSRINKSLRKWNCEE